MGEIGTTAKFGVLKLETFTFAFEVLKYMGIAFALSLIYHSFINLKIDSQLNNVTHISYISLVLLICHALFVMVITLNHFELLTVNYYVHKTVTTK